MEETRRVVLCHPDQRLSPVVAYVSRQPGKTIEVSIDTGPGVADSDWLEEERLGRLLIIEPEPATLLNVISTGTNKNASGSRFRFQPQLSILGGHFDQANALFHKVEIELEGCSSWFGVHGFTSFTGVEPSSPALTIGYEHVKTQSFDIGGGWHFGFGVVMNMKRVRHPKQSLHLEERFFISIEAPEPRAFEDLMREATKALAFIEFGSDNSICICGVVAFVDDQGFEIVATWKNDPRGPGDGIHPLFYFQVVKDNLGDHLKAWFELYDSLPLALDLYRTCKRASNLQVEFRFFGIVSALESLHRNLYENPKQRYTLRTRLEDIAVTNAEEIRTLLTRADCGKVADTRNYLAHQTADLLKKSVPPNELYFWFRRLAMVFEISLMARLPFQHPDAFKNSINARWNAIRQGFFGEWNLNP